MKKLTFLILLLTNISVLFSQKAGTGSGRQIFAVIVGISDYKDSLIKDLKFAHRDAEVFAQYLMSQGGGAVPANNIKLLLQENATVSNIYGALYWLQKMAKKNDLVFFYFAGHGDVESSLYKLGFLLAYDSPYQNYLSNAIRIEDLNIMANTLSVIKEANTILITDACHSGKLAGSDNRGKTLVGEQLSKVEKKEVRLASCEPDELSEEDIIWGGGRGVFSYYLIKGLKSEADNDKDGGVTLQEIENYLGTKVPKDVQEYKLKDQNPVISGKANTVISMVDEQPATPSVTPTLSAVSGESSSRNITSNNESDINILNWFFNYVKDIKLEDHFGFEELLSVNKSETPQWILHRMLEIKPLRPDEPFSADSLQKIIHDPRVQARFSWNFVAMIHDQVQNALNLYLKADEAELARRRYSLQAIEKSNQYPLMLLIALDLIDKDHYLYEMLKLKYHYFKGVSYRFKMAYSSNPDSLLNLAIKEQKDAIALEEKAPYIHNELGVLYGFKKTDELAIKHFTKAIELSPSWAIPLANLSGLLANKKKYQQGLNLALKSIKLSPGYDGAYSALASNYMGMGNWLLAEENLRKSLELNQHNYYILEKMGDLSVRNLKYSVADSFYLQAQLQKRSDDFSEQFNTFTNEVDKQYASPSQQYNNIRIEQEISSPFSKQNIPKNNIFTFFASGKKKLDEGDFEQAELKFKQVATVDPQNPLVFKYLGEIYFIRHDWLQAEVCLKLARKYFLNQEAFSGHIATLKRSLNVDDADYLPDLLTYKSSYYPSVDIEFILGKTYENWGFENQARIIYTGIINESPQNITGNYLLWKLEEKLENFDGSEDVIRNFSILNPDLGEPELFSFYNKRLLQEPQNVSYCTKAANFLYTYYLKYKGKKYFSDGIISYDAESTDSDIQEKFNGRIETPSSFVEIPGIGEKIKISPTISDPLRHGLELYKKITELSKDSGILAEAFLRRGDLYMWAGSYKGGLKNFQRSLEYKKPNSELKMKILLCLHHLNRYSEAYAYLNELKDENTLSFENLLLLAEYEIRQGNFTEANQLLSNLTSIHTVPHAGIRKLEAEAALNSGNFKQALNYYLACVGDPENAYTIARIYALKGDRINAGKWLDKSKKQGFNFEFVINNDPAFKKASK